MWYKKNLRKWLTLVSVLAVAIVTSIYFAHPVAASDPGTSSTSSATGNAGQRNTVTSSSGTIVAAFQAGSQSPTGVSYSTSTDGGATWAAAAAIDTAATSSQPSIAIDSSDNIFVAYKSGNNIVEKKLTYSGGSWSVQSSPTTIATGGSCTAACYFNPNVAIQSGNKIVISANFRASNLFISSCSSWLSTNGGTSWGSSYSTTGLSLGTITILCPTVAIGADMWIFAGLDSNSIGVYKDIGTTGAWTDTTTTLANVDYTNNTMTSSGSNVLDVAYKDFADSTIKYVQYSISGNSFGAATTISSATSDVLGSISAGPGSALDVFYQEYQGSANSYKVAYRKYTGSWSAANYISADTTNNANINSAVNNGATSTNKLGVIWTNGTATPWTIKGSSVAFNSAPAAPTLSSPSNGATSVSATPSFQLKTTDADNDYLRYRIYLCTVSGCNSGTALYTWDQTTSQLGWTGQDQQSGTAYNGNAVLGSSTTASFQPSILLSVGQTYYWVGQAIDPGGTNTWGSLSSVSSFTTTASQVNINGGTNINGGSTIQ